MFAYLADITFDQVLKLLGWVSSFAVVIIGAILGPFLKSRWKEQGKQEAQQVSFPTPVGVLLEDGPVSRREFREFREHIKERVFSLESQQLRAMDNVEGKHLELIATIERAAKTGVDGRVALWNELRPLGQEVAALKATSNVSEQLAKVAEVLKQSQQQSHGSKTTGR